MTIRKVPVKVAAAILGKSEQFVRCGLQYERLKFGVAVCTNPSRPHAPYTYHISPKLFMEYTGCTAEKIISEAERLGVNPCTALNQTAYRLLKTDAKTYRHDNYASLLTD